MTGTLCVLSGRGDTKLTWDKSDPQSVSDATRAFVDLMTKGYAAFATKDGKKDEQIHTFDAEAEEIILVPPIAGG
jgi:hypothetical protein